MRIMVALILAGRERSASDVRFAVLQSEGRRGIERGYVIQPAR